MRVNDCDVIDWLDLPELTSIQMGYAAFDYDESDNAANTLIMRSNEMNVNWLTRLAQTHNTQNC